MSPSAKYRARVPPTSLATAALIKLYEGMDLGLSCQAVASGRLLFEDHGTIETIKKLVPALRCTKLIRLSTRYMSWNLDVFKAKLGVHVRLRASLHFH